jgi:hypothetical protein
MIEYNKNQYYSTKHLTYEKYMGQFHKNNVGELKKEISSQQTLYKEK